MFSSNSFKYIQNLDLKKRDRSVKWGGCLGVGTSGRKGGGKESVKGRGKCDQGSLYISMKIK
jgi:hypothetical protein